MIDLENCDRFWTLLIANNSVIDYHLLLGSRHLVPNYCKSAMNWLWSIIDRLAETDYQSWNCNRFPTLCGWLVSKKIARRAIGYLPFIRTPQAVPIVATIHGCPEFKHIALFCHLLCHVWSVINRYPDQTQWRSGRVDICPECWPSPCLSGKSGQ